MEQRQNTTYCTNDYDIGAAMISSLEGIEGMTAAGAVESADRTSNSWTTEGGRTNKRLKVAEERSSKEERRADKINEQIETLRKLLQGADFPLQSSASKYHVLHSCEKYIQELIMKTTQIAREATQE